MTHPPRLVPVADAGSLPASTATLLAGCTARTGLAGVPAVFGTLAHHPALFERLLGAGLGRMPEAVLPLPQRELVILRTARNCAAEYEWVHHVRHAAERGVRTEQVQLARDGAATGRDDVDAALVAAADELHHTATLSDHAWHRLAQHLPPAAVLEVLVLVGYYRIFAHVENACRVALEPAVAERYPRPWPAEPGASR